MKTSIFRNLKIGFGISIIILLVSSVASYNSIHKLNENSETVRRTDDILLGLATIISELKDAETGQRGYLLTHDPVFLTPYSNSYSSIMRRFNNVNSLIQDTTVQRDMAQLKILVEKRYAILDAVLKQDSANRNKETSIIEVAGSNFYTGKQVMDDIRALVSRIEKHETELLTSRTLEQKKYAVYTPALIIIAALFSLLITILAYFRVKSDFNKRTALQDEIEERAVQTAKRIATIKVLASNIAGGDYSVRVSDDEKDDLGNLAGYLNGMTDSLETAFVALKKREWLQGGIANINDVLLGEKNLGELTRDILNTLANYTSAQLGAFYISDKNNCLLKLCSTFATSPENHPKEIPFGENLIGQAAQSQKAVFLENVPQNYITVSSALGAAVPASVAIVPIILNGRTIGVIELASLDVFEEYEKQLFALINIPVGIALITVQTRIQVEKLLGETQEKSRELQQQQIEMEATNAELEMQTQKLQASEEELKVQQEELIQTNQEIEEKAQLLEEQYQVINEKNSELEEVSRENERKAQELVLSNRYKSEFLANMSHELRTPLNSILLLSQLLSKNSAKNLDEEQVEFASVINMSGKGLLELINEILDLSKIESGKMTIDFEDVLLKDMVYSIQSIFDPIASSKLLKLDVEVDNKLPEEIRTDKMRIEQVLKNFLSNAFKFTEEGIVALKISYAPADAEYSDPFLKGKDVIAFAVKDSGIGIPRDKHQLVFEAFQQADGSTKRKYGGTGLGLSISREIAKMLGGEVQLESEEGKGSTFTLYVPVNSEAVLAEKAATEEIANEQFINVESLKNEKEYTDFRVETIPSEIPDDRENITAQDKVILIVEDDTNFAKALLKFTKERGYKGVVAVRGDLGVEFALRFRPVAILLDIQLPVMDGWTVMDNLKQNPATRHIPVHIMSSMEMKKESLLKGAVNFISKPMLSTQIDDVFQSLESMIEKHDRHVLIVEDNALHAEELTQHLVEANVTTCLARNSKDALRFLKTDATECVIFDISAEEKTMLEVIEKIKEDPLYDALPIIVYTEKPVSKQEELRIKKHASAIIVKTATSYKRLLSEVDLFLHKVEETPGEKQKKRLYIGDKALHGKTVLVVDDDARNLLSLTKALEQQQMIIQQATDGKEALERLKDSIPDVMLLDIMMPEMDGYEVLKFIRNDQTLRNLPVIALTAKTMNSERDKCIQAGASDYISKPVDFDKLLSLLRVWLYR
ncbi:MAG TPA: response regulator [Patescibacteria group bacterium]|nr:response regulator [Patescibacteria group bacterium]